jgi:hypothetical protein
MVLCQKLKFLLIIHMARVCKFEDISCINFAYGKAASFSTKT